MTHVIFCSSSSCVLCDFIEVKDLEETDSGAEKCHPIYLCASQPTKKKEKVRKKKGKKMQTKYQTRQKPPKHKEQRKEERNIQCKHLLLKKHSLCVENTKLLERCPL